MMPFEEIRHTADWSLRVRAVNLEELFLESARGMNALSGIRLAPGPHAQRTFEVSGPDRESLLVAFLSELVYSVEQENLAFDEFEIRFSGDRLSARLSGAPIVSIDKAIKAVTYHYLKIRQTESGYEVEIVFDV
jgi:SHS2 domain-containing protein